MVFSTEAQAWSFFLQQGDNPLKWTVENPMPPAVSEDDTEATGSYEQINGHDYDIQQSCPATDEMIVHDLQPDDAVIQTGTEITPSPSPAP
jgi:hypothetical protein